MELVVGVPNHKGELMWFVGVREVCWLRSVTGGQVEGEVKIVNKSYVAGCTG